jgi:hypothetical protein
MTQTKLGWVILFCSLSVLVMEDVISDDDSPRLTNMTSQLNEANFSSWRDLIRTGDSELVWQQLPWTPSFHDGLAQAAKLNKPLLLWVMNGHPMGCT